MTKKHYSLSANGNNYSPEFQTKENLSLSWQKVLKRVHGNKEFLICNCNFKSNKISVRLINNKYHPAIYPKTGHLHKIDCRFFTDEFLNRLQSSYRKSVVEETPDGDFKILLEESLTTRKLCSQSGRRETIFGRSGVSKNKMTLLGLLKFIWEEANLNSWDPSYEYRSFSIFHKIVRDEAIKIKIAGLYLDQVLVVSTRKNDVSQKRENKKRVEFAKKNETGLVVIAPIANTSEKFLRNSGYINLQGYYGFPFINNNHDLLSGALKSAKLNEDFLEEKGVRFIAIIQTSIPQKNNNFINMLSISIMPVSDRWIPYDSSYELKLENKLVEEKRSFTKPLRYVIGDFVFPDFILNDLIRSTPLEVFGMNTSEYMIRREEKEKFYNNEYGINSWWSWDAASEPEVIPQLPPKI